MPHRIAIMQPYLFPYIGYYQLIQAVDLFVQYDNVNFINRGWINRNNILVNGEPSLFTLSLNKASQNKKINEIDIIEGVSNREKILISIEHHYKKAPEFNSVFPILQDIILNKEKNLADYLDYSLRTLSSFMGLKTDFKRASELDIDFSLSAQERLIQATKNLGGEVYINAYNGLKEGLYNPSDFIVHGIDMSFIKTQPITYKQFENEFIPYLSIIDVLMFNPLTKVTEFLSAYELVKE